MRAQHPIRRRGRSLALLRGTVLTATLLTATVLTAVPATPASAAVAATVSVNAGSSLGTIPATAFGMNVAVYDGLMNDAPIAGLLRTAGVGAVRYPGGSFADIYHWQNNTADNGGYIAPNTSFDSYMTTVKAANAQPFIIANYGSGTPAEAAAWVRYANVTKGYGAKYWEIGNEVYGNGEYGSMWENDTHSSKSATTYANNLVQYITAMKAVDPTIKIGAVLTTPGSWPDALVGPGDTMDWNHTVLSIAGSKIDFGIVHWYPGGNNAADMLTKPQSQVSGMMSTLHSLINQYAGSNAANVKIAITETNSTIDMDTSPAALFAPDSYMTWLENGVINLDWWNLHNGSGSTSTVNGATDYGDQGVLSNASSGEPAAETPFAPYYGISMLTRLGVPGDTMVTSSSNRPLLSTHAVRKANGDLDVLLDNKDPSNAYTVSLSYAGFTPGTGTPTVYSYLANATSITSASSGTSTTQTVPAYSLLTVTLHPGTGGGGTDTTAPSTPANLAASAVTATGATLSWTASTDNVGVAGYDVFRALGSAAFSQVGTATGNTFAATGLTASTGYRFYVRARDAAGNMSGNSTSITVTTPAGGGSSGGGTCRVGYTKSEWAGGLTATVTITNTGTAAINGWTLNFSFPGDTRVTSPWNATVTQTGVAVSATNVAYNGGIAAGANVSFGFQGTWTGNDAAPTGYTLNGSACTIG